MISLHAVRGRRAGSLEDALDCIQSDLASSDMHLNEGQHMQIAGSSACRMISKPTCSL